MRSPKPHKRARLWPRRGETFGRPTVMASWFSFSCTKPRNAERSSLLEVNLAAKSETQPALGLRCESDESVSDANVSLLSEASTAPGIRDGTPPKRRTSFADQQKQPLEKMCACLTFPTSFPGNQAAQSHSPCPALPRRFYVPSRDDVAALMGEDEDDDDGDDIQMILEKLRRTEEDQEDEATLREWMRTQQEAARKTWGVKGDMASLAQYRRRQLLRWGHAQHVFDDEMSDEWNEHQVCTPPPPTHPAAQSEPQTHSCRLPSPQPPTRFLTSSSIWLQAGLLVGGRLHDATQRRELVAALGSPSDDGAITRFFDPIYPSSALSRGLPDDLLREDGDELARSRESSIDQVDVFVDALDRRVGRAFLQLETLFMPKDESISSRAAISGRARF